MSVFMYAVSAAAHMLTFFALLFMIVTLAVFERSVASRAHSYPVSDHFNGRRFFNPRMPKRTDERSEARSVAVWLFTRPRSNWQKRTVPTSKPPERVREGIRITYVNHATALVQFQGINIITDPVWSPRASPIPHVGPKRYVNPGIELNDLPPIDIVLLSHNHYDHMDLAALRAIARAHTPRIYTGVGNAAYLARKGIKGAADLDWWESRNDGTIKITAVPAQHFSARSVTDRNFTLWCGFVIEAASARMYFAGDTGFGPFVDDIAHAFGSFDLGLIPIGAYDPAWMMRPVHTDPEEALRMHDILNIRTSVAIHHGTFRLTDEPQDEPRERIERARGARDFRVLENGAAVLL